MNNHKLPQRTPHSCREEIKAILSNSDVNITNAEMELAMTSDDWDEITPILDKAQSTTHDEM